MPAIVRTLWGDRSGSKHKKLWAKDVHHWALRSEPADQVVYVYGRRNADRLRKVARNERSTGGGNVEIVLVDDDPWPRGDVDETVPTQWNDSSLITKIPWLYKIDLLLAALRDRRQIIYCDWDVTVHVERPDEAFALLEDMPFALTLSGYRQRRHNHKNKRHGRGLRKSAAGTCMFFNGSGFVRRVREEMLKEGTWHDEWAINDVIDDMNEGWPGERFWLLNYENPTMIVLERMAPWKLLREEHGVLIRQTPVPFQWYRMFAQYHN